MRKSIIVAALVAAVPVMGVTVAGCNSAWWQNFQNDPVQQVQTFEAGVQVVLNDAQIAWTIVQPLLPPAQSAQITQQYENAVFAVNHALQVLNDAVSAAIAAQQPNPDFSALMTAVTDAVGQVLAIIHQYMQPAADAGAPPAPVADAGAPPAPQLKMPASLPAYDEAVSTLDKLKKEAKRH